MGMLARLAALIMVMTVCASLGAMMIPSTLRAMKLCTCSSCRLASPSAMASSTLRSRLASSTLSVSMLATQYSVWSVSNDTPMVGFLDDAEEAVVGPPGPPSSLQPHKAPIARTTQTMLDTADLMTRLRKSSPAL